MDDKLPEPLLEPLKNAAASVNEFLLYGLLFALAVVATKWLVAREGKVALGPVELPVAQAWIGILLLTLLHLYFSWSLLVHTSAVLDCARAAWSAQAWQALTGGALRLMFDMGPRVPMRCGVGDLFCSSPAAVHLADPLMLAHVALAVLVFLATACWRAPAGWPIRLLTTLAALAFVLLNWWAGSQWALLVSDLARAGVSNPTMAGEIRQQVQRLAGERARCPRP